MPIEMTDATSESGMRYLIVDISGFVTLAEAQKLGERMVSGTDLHGGYLFSRVAKDTQYSTEARHHLPTLKNDFRTAAVVVTSPIVRAGINLISRLSAGRPGRNVRFFEDENEALSWMESLWASERVDR